MIWRKGLDEGVIDANAKNTTLGFDQCGGSAAALPDLPFDDCHNLRWRRIQNLRFRVEPTSPALGDD